jgi:Tfp pilus assembly protein PilF
MAEKWLGMTYVQLGDCEKAIGFLTAARQLDAADADLSFSLSRAYTKLLFQSYNTIRSYDRNSPFLKAFTEDSRSAFPESSDPALAHVGNRIESGHASEEFVRLSHLIRTTPQNVEYWYWFGKCSEALARQYLEDFLSRSPDSYRIHQLKAEYFLAVNDEGQAVNEYHKALSIKPDAIQVHADLGNLYMVHHEYQHAIEEYQAELQVNPYSLQSLERLGQAYVNVHESEKAVEYLRRAIAINPHSFEALRAMGQVHYQRAEYQQAILRFQSALAVRPKNDSTILYHLVQTYQKLGNKTEAQKWSAELQRQLSKDLTRAQQNVNAAASPSLNQ